MKSVVSIVGMQYRQAEQYVRSLSKGTELELRREPNNDHDPNAVQVWVFMPERHIGYVRATQARKLARMMDRDLPSGLLMAKLTFDGTGWPMAEYED